MLAEQDIKQPLVAENVGMLAVGGDGRFQHYDPLLTVVDRLAQLNHALFSTAAFRRGCISCLYNTTWKNGALASRTAAARLIGSRYHHSSAEENGATAVAVSPVVWKP